MYSLQLVTLSPLLLWFVLFNGPRYWLGLAIDWTLDPGYHCFVVGVDVDLAHCFCVLAVSEQGSFLDHTACPTQPPSPRRTQDTQTKDSSSSVRVLCGLLLPKMEDEVHLKKQPPQAPSAHSDCFLDSSCAGLPQPALSHRHQLMNMLEVGFGRGEECPFNCCDVEISPSSMTNMAATA